MNQVTINLAALQHNLATVNRWMEERHASWTLVTKVLCGHADTLRALQQLGVRSMGDSRLENLRAIERLVPDFEAWYLRIPTRSSVPEVIELAEVSLNSEIGTINELNVEAARRDLVHRIIIMIELGDLREGILPGTLVDFYQQVLQLSHIEVIGIGSNLGCMAGAVPTIDQFMQLALYHELLELKFNCTLPFISAGATSTLPLVLDGSLPKAINHFRIGEAVFLGTDLINGGLLPGLRDDVVLVEGEIAEIKEKGLTSTGETGTATPFDSHLGDEEDLTPGQRGYRALVSLGQLDTDVAGLTPVEESFRIAGASSDITVVNLGDDPGGVAIGDMLTFKPNYAALLRLMNNKYINKRVDPPLHEFRTSSELDTLEIQPALEHVDDLDPDTSDKE